MSNESRVLALFEEANPVPDGRVLDRVDIEPAAYLANLKRRSSEVTQLDEDQQGQSTKHPRARGWAIAAVLALIGGVLAIVLSQNTEQPSPVTDPPPITTTPETVDTTSPEVTETSLSGEDAAWEETRILLSSTPVPGQYRTDKFAVDFRFEITPGWKPAETERLNLIGFTPSSEWDSSADVGPPLVIYFVEPEAASTEDAVAVFNEGAGVTVGAQGPTDIGGAEGVRFEVDTEPFRFQVMGQEDEQIPGVFLDHDKAYEVHIVDVNGKIVTVVVQSPPEMFEDFKARARTVLDSVVWRDLG